MFANRTLVTRTMPKRGAAETATGASASAKKAKKPPAAKEKKDVRGDDIIKLDDAADDAVPVETARKAAKKQAAKMNVHGAFGREKDDRPRVLYIGHVPHGFYEDQMRAYFGQFGDVTRLRLSRNKKTGRSKHYAYVEFKHPEVAAIVAESMDNYLLFESVLKVRLLSPEECHPELWKGANRKFKTVPWRRRAADAHDRERTEEEMKRRDAGLLAGERRRRRAIEAAGIDYDFPGYASKGGDGEEEKGKKRATPAKRKADKAESKASTPAKTPKRKTRAK